MPCHFQQQKCATAHGVYCKTASMTLFLHLDGRSFTNWHGHEQAFWQTFFSPTTAMSKHFDKTSLLTNDMVTSKHFDKLPTRSWASRGYKPRFHQHGDGHEQASLTTNFPSFSNWHGHELQISPTGNGHEQASFRKPNLFSYLKHSNWHGHEICDKSHQLARSRASIYKPLFHQLAWSWDLQISFSPTGTVMSKHHLDKHLFPQLTPHFLFYVSYFLYSQI